MRMTELLRVQSLAQGISTASVGARTELCSAGRPRDSTRPAIVGVLGPNGSGKTTLFELITGSNHADRRVRCKSAGRTSIACDAASAAQLARHYHQSYQIRRFRSWKPEMLLARAARDEALVHLFDEPQLNTQDGYIGFMLRFFDQLRRARPPAVRLPAPERAMAARFAARNRRKVCLCRAWPRQRACIAGRLDTGACCA